MHTPLDEHGKKRLEKILPGLIEKLRETARHLGYALTVHGSLSRDIDLVAIPWVQEVTLPELLASAIRCQVEKHCGAAFMGDGERDEFFLYGCPGNKPWGRRGWTFHVGGGPYIDLSVISPQWPMWEPMPFLTEDRLGLLNR